MNAESNTAQQLDSPFESEKIYFKDMTNKDFNSLLDMNERLSFDLSNIERLLFNIGSFIECGKAQNVDMKELIVSSLFLASSVSHQRSNQIDDILKL